MAKAPAKTAAIETIAAYIAAQPKPAQAHLRRVRAAVRKIVPAAEEKISYRIPAYRLDGRMLLYFAGWKAHVSLYPATAGVVAALKDEIKRFLVSKGTMRFALSEPLPVQLIEAIARVRAAEVRAAAAARKAKPAKKTATKTKRGAAKRKP
jgi:uncharacterized protein YdhG (YjbR/CyaY superfamily)